MSIFSNAPTPADIARITELLGRVPQGNFQVVVRTRTGDPVVLYNHPLLADGTPMPTRYWLVGETETVQAGRLEAEGGVNTAEAEVDPAALADVSDKLLAQFSENLNQLITGAPATSTPTTPAAAAAAPVETATPAPSEQPAIRIINSPEVAPLDLLGTAGAPILKRAIPALIAVVAVVAALVYIF